MMSNSYVCFHSSCSHEVHTGALHNLFSHKAHMCSLGEVFFKGEKKSGIDIQGKILNLWSSQVSGHFCMFILPEARKKFLLNNFQYRNMGFYFCKLHWRGPRKIFKSCKPVEKEKQPLYSK